MADEYPDDDTLLTLAMLIGEIERDANAYFADHRALDAARRALIDEISPAALRLLGESVAGAWLIPCWRALSQRATSLASRADDSDNHAVPL